MAKIKGMVGELYTNLFSSEQCERMDEVLEAIPGKVTAEINADLCKPYSDDEIKVALFHMGPKKVPGRDSFPAFVLPNTLGVLEGRDMYGSLRLSRGGLDPGATL
jgi:hypothetical protein